MERLRAQMRMWVKPVCKKERVCVHKETTVVDVREKHTRSRPRRCARTLGASTGITPRQSHSHAVCCHASAPLSGRRWQVLQYLLFVAPLPGQFEATSRWSNSLLCCYYYWLKLFLLFLCL